MQRILDQQTQSQKLRLAKKILDRNTGLPAPKFSSLVNASPVLKSNQVKMSLPAVQRPRPSETLFNSPQSKFLASKNFHSHLGGSPKQRFKLQPSHVRSESYE